MSDSLHYLPLGAYETPITMSVQERLDATLSDSTVGVNVQQYAEKVQDPRYIKAISRLISHRLEEKLAEMQDSAERIALINRLVESISDDDADVDLLTSESLLHSLYSPASAKPPAIPKFSLTEPNLLTNADSTSSMHSELQREIKTADEVDLICAFVKQAGLRTLDEEFKLLADRGIRFRVIASVYTGATDAAAIHQLASKYGAQVKINYNTERTRLHAKAWLFKRKSGFNTAFIGSSNLSRSAMLDGLEWNVRTTQAATPIVVEKFSQTFDTYWEDPEYVLYDHTNPEDLTRLKAALKQADFNAGSTTSVFISGIDVEPRPHQLKALEALEASRTELNAHRNLIVAATGTGKTITAALDYRRMYEALGRRPKLLFLAHTKEILRQSRAAYAQVLKDGDFGELLVDGISPQVGHHIFASVQSLNEERMRAYAPDHFDVIVIDEFHHAAAPTYRRILKYFTPTEFLGLTATPERADGVHVQSLYELNVADELRLWDALKQDLLAPMHYYGINDETSLVDVGWSATSKDYKADELTELYVASTQRLQIILRELQDKVGNLDDLKALGFCVSVKHAHYMAQAFNERGIPSAAIDGTTDSADRQRAFDELRNGTIKVLFGVNVFNEGLDIRAINTVLLLRPTQSPVLFLQQIGRGLRHDPSKSACVILDFIGMHREDYDVSVRYAALVGRTGPGLREMVDNGFDLTPPGSHIQLDEVTTKQVLDRIRRFTKNRKSFITNQLVEIKPQSLAEFLDATRLELHQIYSGVKDSFTHFKHAAGLLPDHRFSDLESMLLTRIATLLHVDDSLRATMYTNLLQPHGPSESEMTAQERQFARMLIASLWTGKSKEVPETIDQALGAARSCAYFVQELTEVLALTAGSARHVHKALPLSEGVLFSHAQYSAIELKAAISDNSHSGLVSVPQSGVLTASDRQSTLLFINLVKEKKDFSAQTRYADFPLSATLFQWESPHFTKQSHALGKTLINHKEDGHSVMLAMRIFKQNSSGRAHAYTLLGTADQVSYEGECPITFRWELHEPMPGDLLQQSKQAI